MHIAEHTVEKFEIYITFDNFCKKYKKALIKFVYLLI
jgi:hypothetical protein